VGGGGAPPPPPATPRHRAEVAYFGAVGQETHRAKRLVAL